MPENTTSEAFFEAKYQQTADPWQFATSVYERGRYAAILRALEGRRFKRAFEPGCSVGVLTERLARFCSHVEAIDISPTAVSRTRERCRWLANVTVTHGALPAAVPPGDFDLMVLSEIGYYFDSSALADLAASLVGRLERGGVLLAAHWLGTSPDHLLTGDHVHEVLAAAPGLIRTAGERHAGFRMDRWTRR
jgi:SAM-dependent methyltransferase